MLWAKSLGWYVSIFISCWFATRILLFSNSGSFWNPENLLWLKLRNCVSSNSHLRCLTKKESYGCHSWCFLRVKFSLTWLKWISWPPCPNILKFSLVTTLYFYSYAFSLIWRSLRFLKYSASFWLSRSALGMSRSPIGLSQHIASGVTHEMQAWLVLPIFHTKTMLLL